MRTAVDHTKDESQSKTRPKLGNPLRLLCTWLDDRTGFGAPLQRFLTYPVPKYVHKNLLYSLGGLTLISILLQIATGVLLSFYYDPSPEEAYNSVDYVTYRLPLGWLVRGLHHYNASAIVILVVLHLARTFAFSAYKKPRELTWLSGILLLLVLLGFAFTGYLLPWDQRGYWATKVGTEIAASAPVIGEWQVRLIRGGPELGQATLTRFYVVHILLLPGALIMLIGLHLHQLRHHGMAPPITRRGKALLGKFVPFFPHWVVVDASLGLGLLLGLIYLSWSRPAPLEFPADPSSTDFLPRPEWYFLFLFQLLKYFPGPLEPVAAFLIPLLVVGSIMLLPFLDRSEERRPWRKPIATTIGLFYAVSITGLTMIACQADRSGAPVEEVIVVQPQLEATSTLEAAATTAAKVEATEAELAAEVNPPQEVQPPELEAEVEGEDQEGLAAENAPPVQEEQAEALAVPAATEDLEPGISPAAQAPLSSQPNVLIAIEVSQAILDSQASFWAEAPRLEVITKGPKDVLNQSDLTHGPVVTLQAAYDAKNIVLRAEWADVSESILRNGWQWDGARFIRKGNEDRLIFLWPLGNNAEFASKGCTIACHQADNDEDWWMGSESEDIRYDVWQWQSARTNPVGQADDEWWSTLTEPDNPDSSRHADFSEGGGFQENVAEDKRGPAFMHATDLASPFIFAGQEARVDPAVLKAGDVVPGYLLAPFTGSRGDVSAQGRWADDKWVVVLQRALTTDHDDDASFIIGKRLPFGLALMDNKNGIDHTVSAEILILEWE